MLIHATGADYAIAKGRVADPASFSLRSKLGSGHFEEFGPDPVFFRSY